MIYAHNRSGTGADHGKDLIDIVIPRKLHDVGIEIGHPHKRGIAERREWVEHIIGGYRGADAICRKEMSRGDTTRNICCLPPPHEKKIRRRQNDQRDASLGNLAGNERSDPQEQERRGW